MQLQGCEVAKGVNTEKSNNPSEMGPMDCTGWTRRSNFFSSGLPWESLKLWAAGKTRRGVLGEWWMLKIVRQKEVGRKKVEALQQQSKERVMRVRQ